MPKVKNEPMATEVMKPMLHLEGEHARHVAKHKLGAKVKLVIHGKKMSHNMYSHGKGDTHSVGIEIQKVRPFKSREKAEPAMHETKEGEGNE